MRVFFVIIGMCVLPVVLAIALWMIWHLPCTVVKATAWVIASFMEGWRDEAARDTPLPAWLLRADARVAAVLDWLESKLERNGH